MDPDYLLSVRATVILVAAMVIGFVMGALTYAKGRSWPSAVAAGVLCAGGAAVGLHAIVAP